MAQDGPPNPLHKPGWRLAFHDEFDAPVLDTAKWLPTYLPQWSSRAASAPRHHFQDGSLVLRIDEDQPPWCPEFDGAIRCSSLQTGVFAGPVGSGVGQHRFRPDCVVRESQPAMRTYTARHGYFEVRARAVASAIHHVAFWLIGYEDVPGQSAEIAVMEILGQDVTPGCARVGWGLHPWGDGNVADEFFRDPQAIDARDFHIYAADWTATHVDFYLDNRHVRRVGQSPFYPMQMMLSLYARPGPATPASQLPAAFHVDYVRVWQRLDGIGDES